MISLHAEVFKDFRILLIDSDQFVTSPAILADGLSRFRDMLSVVAAEAAWELLVSDITWIGSPTDAHVRKYILGKQNANRFRQSF
jgi:hypothetical protein